MIITEKPEGDIIQNQNFKIIINLKTRNKNKKYNISITQEPIPDDDNKSNDREIEIIDIMEKKIELSAKIPSNNKQMKTPVRVSSRYRGAEFLPYYFFPFLRAFCHGTKNTAV